MYEENRNPFFEVKREKCLTESGIDTGKDVLLNSETNDVLGIVSKGYELVQNKDVNEIFEESLEGFGVKIVKEIDHLDSKTRRWKRWLILDGDSLNFDINGIGDVTSIMVEVFNGYNAKTSFGFNVMGYRWFCENGMITGRKALFNANFPHFIDNPEKLHPAFQSSFENFQMIADIWNIWAGQSFTQANFKEFVEKYTKEKGVKKSSAFLPPKIGEKLINEYPNLLIGQKLPDTKWGAFNALTWMTTHGTNARQGSNVFSSGYNNFSRLIDKFYNDNIKIEKDMELVPVK
jgi:hypothetical protein